MGAYLSQPITDKESTDGEDAKFKYGTTAMQGWRTNMEVRAARPSALARQPPPRVKYHRRALRAVSSSRQPNLPIQHSSADSSRL